MKVCVSQTSSKLELVEQELETAEKRAERGEQYRHFYTFLDLIQFVQSLCYSLCPVSFRKVRILQEQLQGLDQSLKTLRASVDQVLYLTSVYDP